MAGPNWWNAGYLCAIKTLYAKAEKEQPFGIHGNAIHYLQAVEELLIGIPGKSRQDVLDMLKEDAREQ